MSESDAVAAHHPDLAQLERPASVARRDFLQLVGAAALAGVPACSRAQREYLRPYVEQPDGVVPGNPLFFATSMVESGYATGLLVESHGGRPTKVEGNPRHPASLGATSAAEQASVLDFYDPNRAQGVRQRGAPDTWARVASLLAQRGREAGTRVLLEATSSPLIGDAVARLRAQRSDLDVRWFSPLAPREAWAGGQLAFGEALEPRVDLRQAAVLVALDSDFLASGPAALRLTRDFAQGRRLSSASGAMNRLYVVEPSPSVTGMSADHRLRIQSREVLSVAAAVLARVALGGVPVPANLLETLAPWAARAEPHGAWVGLVAQDLLAHRGRSVVLAGMTQPAVVHALAHVLNGVLGNAGATVTYAPSPVIDAGGAAFDLEPLLHDLDAGAVETLVVAGGNPVYAAPADADLERRFRRARESIYLGLYEDETARATNWHVAQAHFLESWGDARAFDGTVSLIQPLASPRFDVKTTLDLLSALLAEAPDLSDRDRLLAYWRRARADAGDWNDWLERGVIPGSDLRAREAAPPRYEAIRVALAGVPLPAAQPSLEICFRPDERTHAGTRTNNAWLMELPHPVTRQAWGNAALFAPATAARLRIGEGDVVTLSLGNRALSAPALLVAGQAEDTVALALGYGRTSNAEEIARGVGANANLLRTSVSPWFASGLSVQPTGERETIALGQMHMSLEGRDDEVLLHRTLEEFRRDPKLAAGREKRHLALYDLEPTGARQWGMVIDLNACVGCAACVVACQAENNIPVVGKAGVAKGRAMHWLRIDRYLTGDDADPVTLLQPMACQQCEKAPCEYVCPVNATTHSADGLNQMVYNRCVGTRFCSNNCPYKVRRFNWFNYHSGEAPALAGVHNPDVTVRARGVMEKCTYCVQRIREAEIRTKVGHREIVDGDVTVACEQACPARAITFGDLADPGSRVSRLRAEPRNFSALESLGTNPRTTYLARIRNPNPETT